MFGQSLNYLPVRQSDDIAESQSSLVDEKSSSQVAVDPSHSSRSRHPKFIISAVWVLTLITTLFAGYKWGSTQGLHTEAEIFSPATPVIKYLNKVGIAGVFEEKSAYQGPPSEERERLWSELYDFGITRIPKNEAAQLVNRTVPIAGDPGYYAVTLDVFHQLHCLTMIRRRIWTTGRDFNNLDNNNQSDVLINNLHMDHCMDSIRQSLMCASDITPLPYVWWDKFQQALPATGVMRTCRDFDAIRNWAREREAVGFDFTILPPDDPLGNVVHYGD